MDLAGAARLARRLHRGEIDEAGRAYVDHLERVAGLVASYGGGGCEQMAAWLHGVSRTGMVPSDLAARRPPRRVVRIVQALTPSPAWESVESYAGRIRSCPGAVLVLRADVTDLCRPEALSALGAGARQRRWDRCRVLLARLGEPVPAGQLAGRSMSPCCCPSSELIVRAGGRRFRRWGQWGSCVPPSR